MFINHHSGQAIRRAALSAMLVLGAALAPAAQASLLNFTAALDGAQAGTPSSASGQAFVQFDTLTGALSIDLGVTGLGLSDLRNAGPNATPVHIHFAPAGSNGPIVFDLGYFAPFVAESGGIRVNVQDVIYKQLQGALTSPLVLADFEQALRSGSTYLNIHTNAFAAGEIRGQITQVPITTTLWLLSAGLMGVVAVRRKGRQLSMRA